jgi:hypothetical protein
MQNVCLVSGRLAIINGTLKLDCDRVSGSKTNIQITFMNNCSFRLKLCPHRDGLEIQVLRLEDYR